MFTIENFISGIQAATNTSAEIQETSLILMRTIRDFESLEDEQRIIGEIPLAEINAIISELESGYECNDSMLWTATTFEVGVQAHDRMRMPSKRPDRNLYELSEHNYEFVLSKASTKYVFAIICYSAIHI